MQRVSRVILVIVCVAIAAMWVYAFGFSPRESINRIYDDQWAVQAESRCSTAREERSKLADLSTFNVQDVAALAKRADIIEKANTSLESMVTDLEKLTVSSEKGRALVPLWIADYRTYLDDRQDYVALLRTGSFERFSETQVEGVPISERIGKFSKDNEIRSCIPPFDLVT